MRKTVIRLLCLVPAIVLAVAGYRLYVDRLSPSARGRSLSRKAFEATFLERGLEVPESGPRDGFWGSRLSRPTPDARLGWRVTGEREPGLFEMDADGCQHYRPDGEPVARILVLGGSVAWGAYASSVQTVYFSVLGRALERAGLPVDITVLAAGAWKSHQDVQGLMVRLAAGESYDLVLFLNGLNDLTGGPTADTLYNGAPVSTLLTDASSEVDEEPGKRPHQGDFAERVRAYLANMTRAAERARESGTPLLIALQPSLPERAAPSGIERTLLDGLAASSGRIEEYRAAYHSLRRGLADLAKQDGVDYVDLSRLFADETATTFVDTWHFTDPGHALLGERLADALVPILRRR